MFVLEICWDRGTASGLPNLLRVCRAGLGGQLAALGPPAMDGDGLFDEEAKTVHAGQDALAVRGSDKTCPPPFAESE